MDKNMINIDDLVRQRFSGGEESERPGAWLHMQQLLDKKMPVRPAGYHFRRTFGIVAGLIMISVLSIGGYNILSSTKFRGGNPGEKATLLTNTGTTSLNTVHDRPVTEKAAQPLVSGNKHTAPVNTTPTTPIQKDKKSSLQNNSGNTISISMKPVAGSEAQNKPSQVSPKRSRNVAGLTTATSHQIAEKENSLAFNPLQQELPTQKEENLIVERSEPENKDQPVTGDIPISAANKPKQVNDPVETTVADVPPVIARATEYHNGKKTGSAISSVRQSPVTANLYNSASSSGEQSKTGAPKEPFLRKDSIRKLTIIERYMIDPLRLTSRLTLDTISIDYMAAEAAAAASPDVEVPSIRSAAIGLADHAAGNNAETNMVPLANYKVASTKTNKWNARSFDEVVRDVKFNLAKTRFYPGVSAGINSYMFGPNNLGGFQLGLFGLCTFGENWGMMGELKYVQRFNNGSVVQDDYYEISPVTNDNYLQGKIEHFFKFSSLQSIEMPIALRYAAGRLNIFGGVNLAYNFAVNAEEITLKPSDSNYQQTASPEWGKNRPTVIYDHFKARFSMGCIAGLSYEFSPSIQLDIRATRNLWDNGAYSVGSSKVSQQLYRASSFQFSVFYRFSQKNQIPSAK